MVKKLPINAGDARCRFDPWVGKIPWRKKWQLASVILLGNPMDRRAWWAKVQFSSVQFSRSVMSDSLQPQGLQQARLLCPSPTPGACSNSCPLSRWCHPAISSSVFLFSSAFNLSQHQGLFQWVGSSHQVAQVLELQLQHQSFQSIFRVEFL